MSDTTEPENKTKVLAKVETSVCGLVLHNLEDMKTVAQLILQSGLAPDSFKTAEQIFVGLQTGAEVGLKPMQALNSIVVIKGKPTLWGDAALALVKKSGLLRSFSEKVTGEGDEMIAVVKSVRVEGEGSRTLECTVESTFSVADAKTAKLWKKVGPWTTHPKRMLKYKARAFNLRDNFPDILFGMHLTEEMYGEEPLPAPESDVLPRDERRMAVPSSTVDTTRAPVVKGAKTEPVIEGREPSRTPVQEPENVPTAIPVQVVEAVVEAVTETETAPVAEDKPEAVPYPKTYAEPEKPYGSNCDVCNPDCTHKDKCKGPYGSGAAQEKKTELVTFQCPKCLRTFQYGKEEGKGVKCECGKGVIVEQGKQEPAEPAHDARCDIGATGICTCGETPATEEKPEPEPSIEEKGNAATLYVEVNGMYVAQGGKDFIEFAAYVLCLDDSEIAPSKLTEEQLQQIKAYIETSGVAIN